MAELRVDGVVGCPDPRGAAEALPVKADMKVMARLLTPECARLMGADDFKIEARLTALFGFATLFAFRSLLISKHHLTL
jgi:hypothetical protein